MSEVPGTNPSGTVGEGGGAASSPRSRLWPLVVLLLGLGVIASVTVCVMWLGGLKRLGQGLAPTTSFTVSGPTVNQVQSLSLLTVQSVQVVSEMEAEASFRKGTWIIRGAADYVVDFSKAELVSRDEGAKQLTVKLPMPVVRNPRLDEQRTRLVTYERTGLGFWTMGTLGSRDEFVEQSRPRMQEAVERAAREEQFFELARMSAERLVKGMLELAGWRVEIQWAAPPPGEKP